MATEKKFQSPVLACLKKLISDPVSLGAYPQYYCSAVDNNNLNSFGCLILFRALAKSKNSLGKRFVQVFKSTAGEMEQTCKRMGQPQDRGNEAVVRLRGLPFQVSKEEIEQFFTGNGSNNYSLLLLLSEMVFKRLWITY